MDTNALLLAEAIISLKQHSDLFKDYIFPIATAFFSAFAGGVSAYYFNRRQDRGRDERENFKTANKIYLTMLSVHSSLMAIKQTYCSLNEVDPLKRAMLIPPVNHGLRKLDVDLSTLSFIKDIPTANKTFKEKCYSFFSYRVLKKKRIRPTVKEIEPTWRNLKRLSTCIANYNCLLDIFDSRLQQDAHLREALTPIVLHTCKINLEDVFSVAPQNVIGQYLYDSEMALVITDHVIKELMSFSNKFPEIAESNIELSLVGNDVRLLRSSLDNEKNERITSEFISVDYTLFSKYTNIPIDYLPTMFKFYGGD